jgi:hypothetical protein
VRTAVALVLPLLLLSCTHAEDEPLSDVAAQGAEPDSDEAAHREALDPRAIDSAIARDAEEPATGAEVRRLPVKSSESIRIPTEAPPSEAPAGDRRAVDVRFANAELANALRLLADAGRFDLVVDGALQGTVTMELRQVRPYDALVTIAESKALEVRREGRVVIVTAHQPH